MASAAAAAAITAVSSSALAHQASPLDQRLAGSEPGQFVRVAPLGPTRRSADGLLEVRLADGQVVKTHGVDPAPAIENRADAAADAAVPGRGLNCADLPRLRVFYMHPSDRRSRWSKPMSDRIRRYMRQMSYRLHADALASSGGRIGADYRVGCKQNGVIDIRPVRTRTTAARDDWSVIQQDMKRAGLDSPRSKYLIWYDDPIERGCGVGNIANDDRKSIRNANNAGPRYAVVYGNSSRRPCWNWRVGMHENGHNMGAVQYDAPKSSGSRWHCNDGLDVMCYDDGGDKSAYTFRRCGGAVFDCRADTYFDTLTERGEWLRGHWNIGWIGNRFLDFATTRPADASPGAQPPR